jgi:hypothetical protein
MKKLSLDLDRLAVESCATGTEETVRGTVRGNDTRITEFCHSRSCPGTACCALEEAQPQPNRVDEPFE